MKAVRTVKVDERECCRCGSTPHFSVDMGKLGKLPFCPVCWIGLAGAMARDFSIFTDFKIDYMNEIYKGAEIDNFKRE